MALCNRFVLVVELDPEQTPRVLNCADVVLIEVVDHAGQYGLQFSFDRIFDGFDAEYVVLHDCSSECELCIAA